MDGLDELARQLPIGQIARTLGVSEAEAKDAVDEALPALVSGLAANASTPGGARSLEKALERHTGSSLLDDGVAVDKIDTDDGRKIVSNIFGGNTDRVASKLAASKSSTTEGIIQKILPIVAPIVLAWLAKKFLGGGSTTKTDPAKPADSGIGDLLGGLLGGGSAGGLGGGIGDLLGGLLGGGKK